MRYAVNAAEMKRYDNNTIEKIGLASEVLMERAALAVTEELKKTARRMKRVLVVAGCGNNGGDGIAVGRLLLLEGVAVDVHLVGEMEKCSPETRHQLKILENLGFSLKSKTEDAEYDMIVDALFGIGLSREITGRYKEMIEDINRRKEKGAFVCAVDIASGICADTGKVMGCAVKADLTVAFAFAKRGQLLYPGREYTGELVVRDIGITEQSFMQEVPKAGYYESRDLSAYLPKRRPDGNKGTFGKVLLIAGSRDMSGACLLCGKAILRMGAGMVKIITPECNRQIVQQVLPEAMLYTFAEEPEEERVMESYAWADVVVIGPGISKSKEACLLMKYVLTGENKPLVIDADGLNLISEKEELKELAKKRGREGVHPMILTPHPGELVRLCGMTMTEYKEDRLKLLYQAAHAYGAIIAGKDAVTITVGWKEEELIINTSGTDGMATAGSGDVLAGVIAGLLAQKAEGFQAAALGVYLHGLAGQEAAHLLGRYGMTAGDIADALGYVLKCLEDAGKEEHL